MFKICHSDTKTRQIYYNKRKLQTNITDEYRCKNPQQIPFKLFPLWSHLLAKTKRAFASNLAFIPTNPLLVNLDIKCVYRKTSSHKMKFNFEQNLFFIVLIAFFSWQCLGELVTSVLTVLPYFFFNCLRAFISVEVYLTRS